jgi:hypothetical protein
MVSVYTCAGKGALPGLDGEFVLPSNKATAVNGHVHEHVLADVDVAVVVHVLVDVAGLFIVK